MPSSRSPAANCHRAEQSLFSDIACIASRYGGLPTLRGRLLVLRAVAGAKRAQGHGIAQHVHRRDAVLPSVTHRAMKQIDRSWLNVRRAALPLVPHLPAQPKSTTREKRHRDDVFIRRPIAV